MMEFSLYCGRSAASDVTSEEVLSMRRSLTVMQDQMVPMKAQPEAQVGRSVECRR